MQTEIELTNPPAFEAITDLRLRRRAGPHLLIGAGGMQTIEQFELARNAGAQFVAAVTFDPALAVHSQKNHYLYVPTISTLAEAHQVTAAGCPLVKVAGPSERLVQYLQLADNSE